MEDLSGEYITGRPRAVFTHRPDPSERGYRAFMDHQTDIRRKFFHILNLLDQAGHLDWNAALANGQWIYFRWTHQALKQEASYNYRMNRIPNNELVRYILVWFEDRSRQIEYYDQLFCGTDMNAMRTLRPERGPLIPGSNDGTRDRQAIRNGQPSSQGFLHYQQIANGIDEHSRDQNSMNNVPEFKNAVKIFQRKMDDPLNLGPDAYGNWPPPLAPPLHLMPAPGPHRGGRGGTSTARFAPYRRPAATVSVPPVLPDLGGSAAGPSVPYRSTTAAVSVAPYEAVPDPGGLSSRRAVPHRRTTATVSVPPSDPSTSTARVVPHRSPTPPVSVPVHDEVDIPDYYDVPPAGPPDEVAFHYQEQDLEANSTWQPQLLQDYGARTAQVAPRPDPYLLQAFWDIPSPPMPRAEQQFLPFGVNLGNQNEQAAQVPEGQDPNETFTLPPLEVDPPGRLTTTFVVSEESENKDNEEREQRNPYSDLIEELKRLGDEVDRYDQ